MGGNAMDDESEILLSHALAYGIYGTDRSYKAGRIAAMFSHSLNEGKINSFIAAVFIPLNRMKAQYPILQRFPILLPYFWIKRIVHYLKGNVKKGHAGLQRDQRTGLPGNEAFLYRGGVGPQEAKSR